MHQKRKIIRQAEIKQLIDMTGAGNKDEIYDINNFPGADGRLDIEHINTTVRDWRNSLKEHLQTAFQDKRILGQRSVVAAIIDHDDFMLRYNPHFKPENDIDQNISQTGFAILSSAVNLGGTQDQHIISLLKLNVIEKALNKFFGQDKGNAPENDRSR